MDEFTEESPRRRGMFTPRPPSAAHPSSKKSGGPKFAPRPPSAAHPDSQVSTSFASGASDEEMRKKKKKGYAQRAHKQITKKHACERACMCALAVSLLWMTSLVVAQEVVQFFIQTPTFGSTYDSVLGLFDVAEEERFIYEDCAITEAEDCLVLYTQQLDAEQLRVGEVQTELQEYLDDVVDELVSCSGAYTNATAILNWLIDQQSQDLESIGPGFVSVITTSGGLCDVPLSTVLSNTANAEAVIDQVRNYKGASDAAVEDLSGQLNRRVAYDLEFLDNTTNGLFSGVADGLTANTSSPQELYAAVDREYAEMMACFEDTGSYLMQSTGETVFCQETSVFAEAGTQFTEAVATYENLQQESEAYWLESQAKLAEYQSLYDTVNNLREALDNAGFISVLNFVDGLELGFVDSLRGDLLNTGLGDLIESPDEIFESVQAQADAYAETLLAESDFLNASNQALNGDTTALVQQGFSDYDPPAVDTNASNAEYAAASAEVVPGVANELSSVSVDDEPADDLNAFVDGAAVNASEAGGQLLEKADPRTWETFQYEDAVFDRLSLGFRNLNDYALALDYAYRILRSLMLIRKYWKISAINTPPADVRTKAGIKSGLFKAKTNILQKIGAALTNPIFNVLLILLFIVLFALAFMAAYTPLYDEYTAGCVDKCYTEIKNNVADPFGEPLYPESALEGTMLYRNSFVVAEQFAFADGDYVASTQIDALNVENELNCRDSVIGSLEVQLNQDDKHNFYNERQQVIIDQVAYLRSCVDLATLSTLISSTPSDPTFVPANMSIDAKMLPGASQCSSLFGGLDAFAENNITTNNGVTSRLFDCSAIDPCSFGCADPNEPNLRGSAFNAACTSEWYLHSTGLGVLMTTAVFFLMNMSRLIFLRGVVKVIWRHLSSHKFSFLASCTEDGDIVYPEEVTKKNKAFRKVIMHRLRIALRRFEAEGLFVTIFGAALNLPWIIILVVLKKNLAFDQDKICDQ